MSRKIFLNLKKPTTSRQAISYVEESLGRRIDSSMFKSCSIGLGWGLSNFYVGIIKKLFKNLNLKMQLAS